jgi:hypothetical protein
MAAGVRDCLPAMNDDLTLCAGVGCPLRDSCLRARRTPLGRSIAFGSSPWDATTCACEHHVALPTLEPARDTIATRAYHRWLREGRPEGRAQAHWREARDELVAEARRGLGPRSDGKTDPWSP